MNRLAWLICRLRGHRWRGRLLALQGNAVNYQYQTGALFVEQPEALSGMLQPAGARPAPTWILQVELTGAPMDNPRHCRVELDWGDEPRQCARCGVAW